MKEIKWNRYDKELIEARIGNVYMHCSCRETLTGKPMWTAVVSICQIAMAQKCGLRRHSLAKAKQDAIRLTEELLIDYHTSIEQELESCGIEI